MKIDLKDLNQIHPFEFLVNADSFELAEEIGGEINRPLNIKGEVRKLVGNKLLLTFNIKGSLLYPCSRCLEDVDLNIDYNFEEEIEMSNDGVILLDEYINDCLFINEPFQILCKEDCKGLCPVCGMNLNVSQCNCSNEIEIDPRLEKLRELL